VTGGTAPAFLTPALEGGEWSASRPGRALPPGEGAPGTHCTGGWVGPRAGLDAEGRGKKSSASVGDRTPAVQSALRQTDWATGLTATHSHTHLPII
jgi:hypothetical protein